MSNTAAGVGTIAVPILTVTPNPQQLPVGKGVTVVNEGSVPITLSTSENTDPSNSWTLAVNGAYPIPVGFGPLWASVAKGSANGTVVVLNKEYNIVNPLIQQSVASGVVLAESVPMTLNPDFPYILELLGIKTAQSFKSLSVILSNLNTTPAGILPVCATAYNATDHIPSFSGGFILGPEGPSYYKASMGCMNIIEDTINVSALLDTIVTEATCDVTVIGYDYSICPVRADGRSYPLGANIAFATVTGGSITLLGALPYLRVLLKSIHTSTVIAQTGDSGTVNVTVNGKTAPLITDVDSVSSFLQWEDGLLLDADTDIEIVAGVISTMNASIIFDMVA